MTIASEIQRIKTNIANAYDALENKGATMPATEDSANLASTVATVSTGGTIEALSITPSTSAQTFNSSSVDGYKPVNVSAVTSSIDANIVAGNIKDGVSILGVTGTLEGSPIKEWYDWKNQGSVSLFGYTLPDIAGYYWWGVAYGNNKLVAVCGHPSSGVKGAVYDYSLYPNTDWVSVIDISGPAYYSICFGDGYFVKGGQGYMAYSTDGQQWTEVQNTNAHYGICYGDGKFVATDAGAYSFLSYSTDHGATWNKSLATGEADRYWYGVCYGNGKFVAVSASNSNVAAYSTDAIHWTETTLPASRNWVSVAYGNGVYVAVALNSNKGAVSTDGITWTETTLTDTPGYFRSVVFAGGYFVTIATGINGYIYSEDGITWYTRGTSGYYLGDYLCFVNGNFIAVPRDTVTSYQFSLSHYYTDTASPTTASTVYEEPFTASALTITSVGTGTITLSNSFTYNYNSAGNKNSVKKITTNGTYDVTEYESAVVNVPLGTKTITANGTYTASTDNLDGYSAVTVDIVGIPREIVSGTWQMPSTLTSFSLPSNVTDVGDYGLAHAFAGCTSLTSVDFSALTTVSGSSGLSSAFGDCTALTSVDLSALTTVSGSSGLYYAFAGCTSLTSVDFSALTTVSGSSGLQGIFVRCTALTDVYFRALKTSSFGSYTNQFSNMLYNTGTGTTHKLHFPSNLRSTISGLTGYPNFGGTSGYVSCLFDLPATDNSDGGEVW